MTRPTERPTPLPAVLAFTFINSVGTGVVTSAIYYITKAGYNFSDRQNFLLGIVLGITYIAGALGAGPLVRGLKRLGMNDRSVLALLMLTLAGLCAVPILTHSLGTIPLWIMVGVYSTLTGVLWPMVESYLSGGRPQREQRRVLGIWNITWSSALIFAYAGISPFIERFPTQVILVLGLTHLLGVLCLAYFSRQPLPHHHDTHEHHDEDGLPNVPHDRERALLATVQVLLPMSYVITSALGPYLAGLFRRMDLPEAWHSALASTWILSRAFTFVVMYYWKGWYGSIRSLALGMGLVLVGFTSCTIAGMAQYGPGDSQALPLALVVVGLALTGIGMGMIYTNAIAYAMRVGKAQVDAGGTHEALIGAGYLLGPACGLLATFAARPAEQTSGIFDRSLLGLTAIVVVAMVVVAVRRGLHAMRHP